MMNLAIVGGGKGGCTILKALYGLEEFRIIGLCDINTDSPGSKLARELGVSTFQNLVEFMQLSNVEVIIEATGNQRVLEQIQHLKSNEVALIDSHLANVMMTFAEGHEKVLRKARSKKESFRSSSAFLVQTYGKDGVIYFTSDTECYDFVEKHNIEIGSIDVGTPIIPGGIIDRCIMNRQVIMENLDQQVYGLRMYAWISPIYEYDDETRAVVGTCGVLVPKKHPVVKAFDVFAPIIIESQSQGAWVGVSDLERLICSMGSQKFDLPKFVVGTSVKDDYSTIQMIKNQKTTEVDIYREEEFGHIRVRGIPLFDEEDDKLVGTVAIAVPRNLAHDLQQMASKLNASTQEMASVMHEIARSAGEVCITEGNLAQHIEAVQGNAANIRNILGFTKSIAAETKMLGLNAAIEAARAGEHGRGFGVVAEEIKKLSDQSKQTAEQIEQLIQEIDLSIQKAVRASEGTVQQSQEQAAATQEITASVAEMSEMAEKLMQVALTL